MGVALYVEGFSKASDCISGEIKLLGCYEVDYEKIYKHRLKDTNIMLNTTLPSMSIATKKYWKYGFESSLELFFYSTIGITETPLGAKSTGVLMYEPSIVLAAVSKILNPPDHLKDEGNKEVEPEEKDDLLRLEIAGKLIAEAGGIIRLDIG